MRKIVIIAVVALAVAFVIFSMAELQNIRSTLKEANLIFLVMAFLVEMILLCNTSATFFSLYRLVGLEEGFGQMFLMASAANFVNLIAPSAGVGGIAVFLDVARRRNMSTARVMVVGILYLVYEYLALFFLLTFGFIVLFRRNNLNAGEVIAAVFLVVLASAIGMLLVLGYRSSEQLGKLLASLTRLTNRLLMPFLHRDYLSVESAYKFSQEIAEGIATMRGRRKNLVWPLVFTLNNKVLLLCILAFAFLALNAPLSISTLVGGLSISYLFFYASPTPSGVGMVEGILPAVLSTLRVPFTDAVLITLVFRAVTLWFPFAIGVMSFRLVQKRPYPPLP